MRIDAEATVTIEVKANNFEKKCMAARWFGDISTVKSCTIYTVSLAWGYTFLRTVGMIDSHNFIFDDSLETDRLVLA